MSDKLKYKIKELNDCLLLIEDKIDLNKDEKIKTSVIRKKLAKAYDYNLVNYRQKLKIESEEDKYLNQISNTIEMIANKKLTKSDYLTEVHNNIEQLIGELQLNVEPDEPWPRK